MNVSRGRRVLLVANLGYDRAPNGQTQKSQAVLDLLGRTGRRIDVVDVANYRRRLLRMVPAIIRGETTLIMLNRTGLWVALAAVRFLRGITMRQPVVLVPVVGGWLPDYLSSGKVYRWLARAADEFLVETPQVAARLRQHGLEASELVNFRALPIDFARVRHTANSPLRLCFAGRVRNDKGVVWAAQLVQRLAQLGLQSDLDIYGPIEHEHALRDAMALPGVHYRGCYAGAQEALSTLSSYDLLVLPTSYEGECMPGAVVEACFAGLPAVVSDWKDLRHIVTDGVTGIVCPLDEFVAVAAQRIHSCVTQHELERLSRNALRRAEELFTEEHARAVLLARVKHHEALRRSGAS